LRHVGSKQTPAPCRHPNALCKGDAENEARFKRSGKKLANLGWVQGRNVEFDERWTTDNMDTVRSQAASLMASNPDVVITTGGRVVPVLMHLSTSIPIVLRVLAIRFAWVMRRR